MRQASAKFKSSPNRAYAPISHTVLQLSSFFDNIESLPEDYNLKHVCVQDLKHSPRTARGNATGDKALISGGDVALSTVLNLSCSCGQIELEVGDPNSKKGTGAASGIDYGGSNASGHEFWIDDNRLVPRSIDDRVQFSPSIFSEIFHEKNMRKRG